MNLGRQPVPLRALALPCGVLIFIVGGLVLRAGPLASRAHLFWLVGLALTGLPVVWRTARGALAGRFAADLVAMLAIITALLIDQPLPGLVVVLMQTGGEALERYAAGRASDAVRELEAAAPRVAHRHSPSGIEDITAEEVEVGDRLLIRPGEMIPCDGEVESGHSHVDASRLTGEPIPVRAGPGVPLMSGSLNQESPFVLVARAPARESQYARIVELVRQASATKSPLLRLADRYAAWFTPLTLLVCAMAWFGSRDVTRVLAVLVVATPCPLILAAPVAMIGGINQAARRSVIVRHGEALERLGSVTAAAFDKTGTLTLGRPSVAVVHGVPPFTSDRVLALAASLEQASGHLLARSVVAAAARADLSLSAPKDVNEAAGQGVTGTVEGHHVAVGAWSFVAARSPAWELEGRGDGDSPTTLRAWVAVDGQPAGTIDFADEVRPGLPEMLAKLSTLGVRRFLLLTGDHADNARAVAAACGIREVMADLLPAEKVAAVDRLERSGERVAMVGDGTNDAPALRRATVGVALAAHGGGITAEAADVVLLADDPARLVEAIAISRRTLTIARQSIWAGLGLSAVAMVFAALGRIPPTGGALLQEGIDVAVILNALRASRAG